MDNGYAQLARAYGLAMTAHPGITATHRHERVLLERLSAAAAGLDRAQAAAQSAREARDIAVRAAVKAGIPRHQIAAVAGVSGGLVSMLAPQL